MPLEYLRDPSYTSYDVDLTVEITPAAAGATPTVVSRSNYRNQYWTCRQQLTHHAVTGCATRLLRRHPHPSSPFGPPPTH